MKTSMFALLILALPAAGWAQIGCAAQGYGLLVTAGTPIVGVGSGPTALTTMCTRQLGQNNQNSAIGITIPGVLSTGALSSSVSSIAIAGGAETQTVAEVASISILGVVSVDSVKSVSSATGTSSGYGVSTAGTTFGAITILGIPFVGSPAPNTNLPLPGIGYVVLNEQNSFVNSTEADQTVNGVDVVITTAVAGLPVGTRIVVAHAYSSTKTAIAQLTGHAFATSAELLQILHSGPTAWTVLPCIGTHSLPVTHSLASVSIAGVLTTGALSAMVNGVENATMADGMTTASVASLNLLNSLVTLDAVTAVARAQSDGTTIHLGDAGSQIVNLSVLGHPEIGHNPPPNTVVDLVGIGTLYLHRVDQTANEIHVTMVQLDLVEGNPFGLPAGLQVKIAVADTAVR